MTRQEFSDSFDTLLSSYAHKADFGDQSSYADVDLDEYEKSIFLTQAQDNIVKSYFERTGNSQGQGFDDSARRQVDFSSLIKVAELIKEDSAENIKFDDRGIIYQLPRKIVDGQEVEGTTDVLFILNEKLIRTKESQKQEYVIVPINYKEYDREMSKPYSQPLKKQAWRLFQNQASGFDIKTELIPRFSVTEEDGATFKYRIRYVRRPSPIILEDLPEPLTIDGISDASDCELNPILHADILEEAVKLALNSKGIETRDQKAAREAARNNRS